MPRLNGYRDWLSRPVENRGTVGCDVHFYLERRNAFRADRSMTLWECIPPPVRDFSRYPLSVDEQKRGEPDHWWGPGMTTSPCYGVSPEENGCSGKDCTQCMGTGRSLDWYHNRNYRLFSVLAGVRNTEYNGHRAITPIAEPRGEPSDMSDGVRNGHWWEHSASWLLYSEVLSYEWDLPLEFRCEGRMPLRKQPVSSPFEVTYTQYRDTQGGKGEPHAYYASSGRKAISMAEADKLLTTRAGLRPATRAGDDRNLPDVDVIVTWNMTPREACSDFLDFCDELVDPLLGPEYAEIKSVLGDAIEERYRTSAKDDGRAIRKRWSCVDFIREGENLRRRALEIASDIRFVFGFDS